MIHAGARTIKREEILDLIERCQGKDGPPPVTPELALPLLRDVLARFDTHVTKVAARTALPLSVGLCSAVLGQPVRAVELFAADSDRIDEHVFAWPLTDVQQFKAPIEARGAQGFWPWAPEIDKGLL